MKCFQEDISTELNRFLTCSLIWEVPKLEDYRNVDSMFFVVVFIERTTVRTENTSMTVVYSEYSAIIKLVTVGESSTGFKAAELTSITDNAISLTTVQVEVL